jgi:hypothetical protein
MVRSVIDVELHSQIGRGVASGVQLFWCTAEIFPRNPFSNSLDLL